MPQLQKSQVLEMWRSQPKSASVACGFHVQNPSDSDSESVTSPFVTQSKFSTSYYSYCNST